MKVLAACGSGMGSRPNHQNENYECLQKIKHSFGNPPLCGSEAKTLAPSYDVVVCSNSLLDVFQKCGPKQNKNHWIKKSLV